MIIKITDKAVRGIGIRGKDKILRRYETGDTVEVSDNIAEGIISSGYAKQVGGVIEPEEVVEETTEQVDDEIAEETDEESDDEESVEEEVPVVDYNELTVKELQVICEERNLDTTGKKSELIARLEA